MDPRTNHLHDRRGVPHQGPQGGTGLDSAVSLLFVPASRPDRFEGAVGSGADLVVIDLEDAVEAESKAHAREGLVSALRAGLRGGLCVRVNGADTEWFEDDIKSLVPHARALAGVVVPMAESADVVDRVAAEVFDGMDPAKRVVAMVETAAGLNALDELVRAGGVARLALGSADLSFDLGVDLDSPTMDWAVSQVVVRSRAANLPGPIASPCFDIQDEEAVRRSVTRGKALGAAGQFAIHPRQLSWIHEAFAPTAAQLEWAVSVLRSAGDGAEQVSGKMVDRPIRARAMQILAQAGRSTV